MGMFGHFPGLDNVLFGSVFGHDPRGLVFILFQDRQRLVLSEVSVL